MLDIRFVRENTDKIIDALQKRGQKIDILDKFLEIEQEGRDLLRIVEEQRQLRNRLSQEIGKLKKEGRDATDILAEAKSVSDNITAKEENLRLLEDRAKQELLLIPNIPHESVPIGKDDTGNKEIRTWGDKPQFTFEPKNHWDIGENLGILDFERAGKIAGARLLF